MDDRDKELLTLKLDIQVGGRLGVGIGGIGRAEPLTEDEKQKLANGIEASMTQTNLSMPSCCIDGRCGLHNLDGSRTEVRPAVAGGALLTSYVGAELAGWFEGNETEDVTVKLDLVNTQLRSQNITPGGHCDKGSFIDLSLGKNGVATNCGANDKAEQIIANLYDNQELVSGLTSQLIGGLGLNEQLDIVAEPAIKKAFSGWDSLKAFKALRSNGDQTIEVLDRDNSPTGGHYEDALLVNYHEGDSLDRDAFYEQTGQQVFKLDMWYLDHLAKIMARGPHAESQYHKLLNSMVAYQVATYLTLCDGSQLLITAH